MSNKKSKGAAPSLDTPADRAEVVRKQRAATATEARVTASTPQSRPSIFVRLSDEANTYFSRIGWLLMCWKTGTEKPFPTLVRKVADVLRAGRISKSAVTEEEGKTVVAVSLADVKALIGLPSLRDAQGFIARTREKIEFLARNGRGLVEDGEFAKVVEGFSALTTQYDDLAFNDGTTAAMVDTSDLCVAAADLADAADKASDGQIVGRIRVAAAKAGRVDVAERLLTQMLATKNADERRNGLLELLRRFAASQKLNLPTVGDRQAQQVKRGARRVGHQDHWARQGERVQAARSSSQHPSEAPLPRLGE